MTVIAAYSDGPIAFLLADTLITTGKPYRSGIISLPISSGTIRAHISLNEDWETYLSDYRQKISIINSRLAIAWAGTSYIIYKALATVREQLSDFSGNLQELGDSLQAILSEMPAEDREHLAFVAIALTGPDDGYRPYHIAYGVDRFINPMFPRELFMAGSGTLVMQNNLSSLMTGGGISTPEGGTPQVRYIGLAIGAIGLQYFNELIGAEGLDQSFGGPFEIVLREQQDDRSFILTQSPEIAFLYWKIAATEKDRIGFDFNVTIIYQKYIHDSIITATEFLELGIDGDGNVNPVKTQINMSVIAGASSGPFKHHIEAFLNSPVFAPKWVALFFMEPLEEKFTCHFRLEFDNTLFSLQRAGNNLMMKLDKSLLDPILAWYASERKKQGSA